MKAFPHVQDQGSLAVELGRVLLATGAILPAGIFGSPIAGS